MMDMRYVIFPTDMGSSGVVFNEDGLAVRVLLPATQDATSARIRQLFPDAVQEENGSRELCALIRRFLSGASLLIPMKLVDESVCGRFQLRVLNAEREIPRGMTASYSWLAERIDTKAVRAVGSALARNPFPIVVPCHRAVRSDGSIGGFQGGAEMKRHLLKMEGVHFDARERVAPEYVLVPGSSGKAAHLVPDEL